MKQQSVPRAGLLRTHTRRRWIRALVEILESRVFLAGTVFDAPTFTPAASSVMDLTTADFNGDGAVDVAVICPFNGVPQYNSCLVFFNDGTGNYSSTSQTNYTFLSLNTASGSTSLTTGDFNGDGRPDLAITNSSTNTVTVYLNTGAGHFGLAANYNTGTRPVAVAAGDINGDGMADLVVANYSSDSVSLLLNLGAGTFSGPSHYAVGAQPASLVLADYNLDGKLDVAVANASGNTVSVLYQYTLPATTPFMPKVDYATGTRPVSLVTGDFNGDGRTDLAAANGGSASISMLLNSSNGGFDPKVDYGAGSSPSCLTVADFDGDGKQDLACGNGVGNAVGILLNQGAGVLGARVDYAVSALTGTPFRLAAAAVDANASPDLIVLNTSDYRFQVVRNHGDGTFPKATDMPSTLATAIVSADFNGDSLLDMAAMTNSSSVTIKLNNGNGTWTSTNYTSSATFSQILAADFSGDGVADVALLGSSSCGIAINHGDGSLGNIAITPTNDGLQLAVATDFNGDHIADIAYVRGNNSSVSVRFGGVNPNGLGFFGQRAEYALGGSARGLTAADFNGDGLADLAVTNANNTLSVLMNAGDGSFAAHVDYAVNYPFTSAIPVKAADFDGDGWMDLGVANLVGNAAGVRVMRNLGNGNFTASSFVASGANTTGEMTLSDVNGDGRIDAIIWESGIANVHLNTGNGVLAAGVPFATPWTTLLTPYSVLAADVSGDGLPELIGAGKAPTVRIVSNVSQPDHTVIIGRHVFYGNSHFDNGSASASAADDAGVAPDKVALLPGQTASFANYTSYSRGINGIMMDLTGPRRGLTASDFVFRVGNSNTPDDWAAAPAALAITERLGDATGTWTRVEITWPDNAIENQWLQVTLKGGGGSTSGLSNDDVFYFGNAIGEWGNSPTDARVDVVDELAARAGAVPLATLNKAGDFNRDGKVDGDDQTLARTHISCSLSQLQLIVAPGVADSNAVVPLATPTIAETPVPATTPIVAEETKKVTASAAGGSGGAQAGVPRALPRLIKLPPVMKAPAPSRGGARPLAVPPASGSHPARPRVPVALQPLKSSLKR